jgi:hypothetical protein
MVLLASDFDRSRFLKAADLDGEKKFRIKSVTAEEIGADKKERKPIVWFTNDERGLPLNLTNLRTLSGAFGDNMEAWAGKIIVVFPTMVDMRGKMVSALRVRIPPPKQTAAENGQAATAPASEPVQTPAKPSLASEMNDDLPW